MSSDTRAHLGIDTGGTFTDYYYLDENAQLHTGKVSTTPGNPTRSISRILDELDVKESTRFLHGTTVATNALLESNLSDTVLVTNSGLQGLLRIGRGERENLYDLTPDPDQDVYRNVPVVEVPLRQHPERDDKLELSEDERQDLRQKIRNYDPDVVAVCLIHSYRDFSAENLVADALEPLPQPVVLSSDVLPRFREFERASTTLVNAGLKPIVSNYVDKLRDLDRCPSRLRIMGSSRGSMNSAEIVERPILSTLSGPTAGLIAAKSLAAEVDENQIISMDMGGTSTDVSCISGEINLRDEHKIGGYPIGQPMVDIHTVGSGGGSKLWVDEGGHLRVGPESAGADPGPACYGQGGPPTLTDASLILGRIPHDRPLSEDLTLHEGKSRDAVSPLSERMDLPVEELALGAIEIAISKLTEAIRTVTIREGRDPTGMNLVAFGGAGGLFAAEVAEQLDIEEVHVPRRAGVASAIGLLEAPCFKQHSISPVSSLQANHSKLPGLDELKRHEPQWFNAESSNRIVAECRYRGQTHTLGLNVSSSTSQGELAERFRNKYRAKFNYEPSTKDVELVHLNSYWKKSVYTLNYDRSHSQGNEILGEQKVVSGDGYHKTQMIDLDSIRQSYNGPKILSGTTTTVFLPETWTVKPESSLMVTLRNNGRN